MKSKILIGMLLAAMAAGGALAAVEETEAAKAAKRDDIRKMMDVTGAGKLGIQVMHQMIAAYKQENVQVPDKFWTDFMAEVDADELVEMCIPSYERYFTHDEIRELLAFYETPLGKKLIRTQPAIMRECMIAGQQWGRKIGEKIARRLEEEQEKESSSGDTTETTE